jgi:hypothetical protein
MMEEVFALLPRMSRGVGRGADDETRAAVAG